MTNFFNHMNKIELYKKLNSLLHRTGLDFKRFPTPEMRNLIAFLKKNDVSICLDVGANRGQYAKLLRSSGFQGEILSFEPQSKAFIDLEKQLKKDKFWKGFNIGFGDINGVSVINISKNSVSSSILNFEGNVSVNASPETIFIDKEEIILKRIDTFMEEEKIAGKIFLKIDAQGFESKILDGVGECFDRIFAIQLELSYVALYEGEKLFDEMKTAIESKGFYLSSLQNGFTDPADGKLLQLEGIFFRDL